MKNMYQLSSSLSSEIRLQFESFKSDQSEVFKAIEKFKADNLYTVSGKLRYPQYVSIALSVLSTELITLYSNKCLIFCYEVEGVLYTTFNSKNRKNYYFEGETSIQNYRQDSNIESKIMDQSKNSVLKRGLFYPCGKPYSIYEGR